MITILDRKGRPTPPPWLEGARDLAQCLCDHGTLWSCAEPALMNGTGPFVDLADGYAVAGRFEPGDLVALERQATPYQTKPVRDLRGWEWQAPQIINEDGDRQFAVAYGDDWLPTLTDEQAKAMEIANEARLTFGRQLAGEVDGVDMRAGCAWTATLLCLVYHLTPQIMARLRLVDDALVIQTLAHAADLPTLRVA